MTLHSIRVNSFYPILRVIHAISDIFRLISIMPPIHIHTNLVPKHPINALLAIYYFARIRRFSLNIFPGCGRKNNRQSGSINIKEGLTSGQPENKDSQ